MNLVMAVSAERYQILATIVAEPTAEAIVVNVKILHGTTMLAPPAITFEYLCANSMIIRTVQSGSRLS
jgi:hypothetical protein